MPKNLTISISDELAERMNTMPEINWSEVCRQAISKYIDEKKFKEKGELIIGLEEWLEAKSSVSETEEVIKRREIERFTKKWGKPETISFRTQPPHIQLRKIQPVKIRDMTLKIYNDPSLTITLITPSRLSEFDAGKWKNIANGKLGHIVDYFKSKGFAVGECGELPHVHVAEYITDGDINRASAIGDKVVGLFALDKEDIVFIAHRLTRTK